MNYRYCARILLEATTPLKIGTGEAGLITDELVATDANGLPVIPGTALTGVLRHSFKDESKIKNVFGFQEKKEGKGSRLIISNANFVGKDGEVIDGLADIDFSDEFYKNFKLLPVRDHTRITEKGVADSEAHGKFDEQIVYKGCRFVFDMELIGDKNDVALWQELLSKLRSPLFRIGSGTRKGFGELKIVRLDEEIFDLTNDVQKYMSRSAKLSVPKNEFKAKLVSDDQLITYELYLEAEDFFIFSSGYGDNETDTVVKKEPYIIWSDGKPTFTEEKILLPATSVKGAISHRTAFHYNRLAGYFADQIPVEDHKNYVGENNTAVRALFGFAKNSEEDENYGQRGRVIFSDLFVRAAGEKIFDHVAIDRFTGGAIDGALYNEKVVFTDENIILKIAVEKEALENDDKIMEAFECTLKDIATGMLPLGGNVMRGHGSFTGKVFKNGKDI
ncbi:protein of unknown function DUF324 [Caldithrix abyssi DSM 13497]|uniref:CRISPR/Cas system CSM-associated protein Csm3, group 7 of RAMP superfamily n=1 Tax=Caldithrix abyssi DSM 13497 TaxID=880073 RepID=H1XUD6_CALAY|nr:RAMP superfamily CRISPR-associated protein [Caldithrix abyssi]APF18784.1 CRISPR/Cas system CSM-associated protein Csm3, group 7 of RAMP superfamily [Caldithrix abyssi DSM 13497]EHO42762.1 protein of unknown function DUF324 [Caldithrix abyssi DSM 13497]